MLILRFMSKSSSKSSINEHSQSVRNSNIMFAILLTWNFQTHICRISQTTKTKTLFIQSHSCKPFLARGHRTSTILINEHKANKTTQTSAQMSHRNELIITNVFHHACRCAWCWISVTLCGVHGVSVEEQDITMNKVIAVSLSWVAKKCETCVNKW